MPDVPEDPLPEARRRVARYLCEQGLSTREQIVHVLAGEEGGPDGGRASGLRYALHDAIDCMMDEGRISRHAGLTLILVEQEPGVAEPLDEFVLDAEREAVEVVERASWTPPGLPMAEWARRAGAQVAEACTERGWVVPDRHSPEHCAVGPRGEAALYRYRMRLPPPDPRTGVRPDPGAVARARGRRPR